MTKKNQKVVNGVPLKVDACSHGNAKLQQLNPACILHEVVEGCYPDFLKFNYKKWCNHVGANYSMMCNVLRGRETFTAHSLLYIYRFMFGTVPGGIHGLDTHRILDYTPIDPISQASLYEVECILHHHPQILKGKKVSKKLDEWENLFLERNLPFGPVVPLGENEGRFIGFFDFNGDESYKLIETHLSQFFRRDKIRSIFLEGKTPSRRDCVFIAKMFSASKRKTILRNLLMARIEVSL